MGAALLLDALLVMVWAQRHSFVLRATRNDVPAHSLLLLVTFSNAANNLTPAATGEVARVWFLKRNHDVPTGDAGAAIVFERVFLLGLMALTALAAGLFAASAAPWIVVLSLIGVVLYVLALPSLLAPLSRRLAGREIRGGRLRRTLMNATTGGIDLWSSRTVALGTALWCVAAFALQGAVFWIAANNSGLALNPVQTWALLGGGTVVGVISALPFGLGAAEITAAGIGGLLGLDPAEVASAFVLYRLFLTFPLALVGSFAYARLSTVSPTEHPD